MMIMVILYLNPAPGNSSAFSPLCDEQPGAYEDNIRTKRMFASGI